MKLCGRFRLDRANEKIISFLRKVDIFKRLIIVFATLLLISAGVIAFFSFYNYSKEAEKDIERYIALLAQNVKLKVEDSLAGYEHQALGFYSDPAVIRALADNAALPDPDHREKAQQAAYAANKSRIEHKLYSVWGNQKDVVNVQFVTPREQYYMVNNFGYRRGGCVKNLERFYTTPFYTLPQEKQGYPVWFDTREQSSTFYKSEQSVYGIGNTVTLCVSVYNTNTAARDFLGILVFNIDVGAFAGAGSGFAAYENGNTFLVGESGVLYWFNPTLKAPSFPEDDNLYQKMQQEQQGILQSDVQGGSVLISFQPVQNTGFFVVHVADKGRLLADTYRIRDLCLAVLMGVVLICFLVSYFVAVSISSPISRLINVMKKTGEGKWNMRYQNSGRDEIAILGDRFNEMADKTNQLIDQVYRSEIRRKEALLSQKNAELDALQMQINPHFFYNTLDIIRWEAMCEAGGETPATHMIETFGKLYRMGMKAGRDTISLADSLEHAQTYLEVINYRHLDKIELRIETEVAADQVFIPQFLLQPILENAVVHAFGGGSKGFSIEILSFREPGGALCIRISDNGKGMTPEESSRLTQDLENDHPEESSVGLRNVNQRIKLFYGSQYGVTIESREGQGTAVTVTLPVRTHSECMGRNGEGGDEDV